MSALLTAVAASVPFDNATNGFLSDNVQDAIEETRNLVTNNANFGYAYVSPTQIITIPTGQEMVVSSLEIDGSLVVDGMTTILDLEPASVAPLNPIPDQRIVRVFASEQLLIYDSFEIDGTLYNDGSVLILAA